MVLKEVRQSSVVFSDPCNALDYLTFLNRERYIEDLGTCNATGIDAREGACLSERTADKIGSD